jgi:phosphoglycolate phosphatase
MQPPFDAVIFDLDGTLVATDRFWPDAARAGALVAFAELGLDREPPSPEVWMGMVGLPLDEGFDKVFDDLPPDQRAHLMAACVREEHRLLDEGRAGLLPGTEAALEHLQEGGVRMGIASNCSQAYLDAMMTGMGIGRWIEEGRCLDSPRISNKADMVQDLLLTFGTRSAVMVGDRTGDRDSAWANGIPHIHLSRGYAVVGERVEAEAVLQGLDQLPGRLEARNGALDGWIDSLEIPSAGATIGIAGKALSGRSLFARDLARRLEARGRATEILGTSAFVRDDWQPAASPDPLLESAQAVDLDALAERLAVPRDGTVVRLVEGPGLVHPRVGVHLDRQVWLDVPPAVAERRARGRDARLGGPGAIERSYGRWRALDQAVSASALMGNLGVVVDASNALGPLPFTS